MTINKRQNILTKYINAGLAIIVLLLMFACGDPAIYYQPKDWAAADNNWFAKSFDEIDLKITDLGGITIKKTLIPEIVIYNRGKAAVVLEKAMLKAGGREYFAHPFGNQNWEEIPANETHRLAMEFEFDGRNIQSVLQDPVEIVLEMKTGNKSNKISIPMIERNLEN